MINFSRYTKRSNGERVAKISVEFVIDRESLVKGAIAAIVDAAYDYSKIGGSLDGDTDATYTEVADSLTRTKVEKALRNLVFSYGSIALESTDDYVAIDYGYSDLVHDLADAVVSRLYPELSTEVAA